MTQDAKTTFREEIKRDWNCGKSTSKTRLWHWIKRGSAWRIRAWVFSARGPVSGVVSDGLRRLPPTSVGEADLGDLLALLGPVG